MGRSLGKPFADRYTEWHEPVSILNLFALTRVLVMLSDFYSYLIESLSPLSQRFHSIQHNGVAG